MKGGAAGEAAGQGAGAANAAQEGAGSSASRLGSRLRALGDQAAEPWKSSARAPVYRDIPSPFEDLVPNAQGELVGAGGEVGLGNGGSG
jgi:hypothetical protein